MCYKIGWKIFNEIVDSTIDIPQLCLYHIKHVWKSNICRDLIISCLLFINVVEVLKGVFKKSIYEWIREKYNKNCIKCIQYIRVSHAHIRKKKAKISENSPSFSFLIFLSNIYPNKSTNTKENNKSLPRVNISRISILGFNT